MGVIAVERLRRDLYWKKRRWGYLAANAVLNIKPLREELENLISDQIADETGGDMRTLESLERDVDDLERRVSDLDRERD